MALPLAEAIDTTTAGMTTTHIRKIREDRDEDAAESERWGGFIAAANSLDV